MLNRGTAFISKRRATATARPRNAGSTKPWQQVRPVASILSFLYEF
uniref:Uncharacterized protein n=1 Tax=Anguilla anguilla TaxID=7936 RepID=A0A0E9RVA5_ANGAN